MADDEEDDGPIRVESPRGAHGRASAMADVVAGGMGGPTAGTGLKGAMARTNAAMAGRRATMRSRAGDTPEADDEQEDLLWSGLVEARYDGRRWLGSFVVTPDRVVFLADLKLRGNAPYFAGLAVGALHLGWAAVLVAKAQPDALRFAVLGLLFLALAVVDRLLLRRTVRRQRAFLADVGAEGGLSLDRRLSMDSHGFFCERDRLRSQLAKGWVELSSAGDERWGVEAVPGLLESLKD